jgi:esterase/lipase superfamily enzyme
MPTPSLYQSESGQSRLFESTVPDRRSTDVELFYVTDRAPETDLESGLPYGEARANSLTFGTASVEMIPGLTWPELAEQSTLPERKCDVFLELGTVRELGRFPEEPYEVQLTSAGIIHAPEALRQHEAAKVGFQNLLQNQLQHSPSGEVVLYIHGFNETFETAAATMAELCHFLGREHACGIFTWPASASGNFLLSYTTTTESATFAVAHLEKTIRMIAQTPGVKRVNLLAHSRGTAILLNALRELVIEIYAAGVDPIKALKIDNVVLLAQDIDVEVAEQQMRVVNANPDMVTLWPHAYMPRLIEGRWTIYASPQDRALSVSRFLFRSRYRMGQIDPDELREDDTSSLYRDWGKLDVIVYRGKRTDRFGHAYFLSNPQVSSDLIQLIRYGTKPGEPGRPLKRVSSIAWIFPGADREEALRDRGGVRRGGVGADRPGFGGGHGSRVDRDCEPGLGGGPAG